MDSQPPSKTLILTSNELYQHLNKVSRSFAITIPFMQTPLKDYVGLAYLLCRIVDTVEDDAKAHITDKITWLSDFSFLASDEFSDEDVLLTLKQRALELTEHGSSEDERALLKDLDKAVQLLLSYDDDVKEIICHAVSILSFGMASSLRKEYAKEPIATLDDLDNYCYFVAGVVGEMLGELFCLQDSSIDKKELMELSVSFGEGLQLTNILRDRAKDKERGVSFLPKNEEEDILQYVAITQGHLDDAINFITSLPAKSCFGVRLFCFTNVAMAMYLLRKIARNPLDTKCDYKMSRGITKRLFILCRLVCHSNFALRFVTFLLSFGMKRQRRSARQLRDKVSLWDHSSSTN